MEKLTELAMEIVRAAEAVALAGDAATARWTMALVTVALCVILIRRAI